ncbi:MAG: hypothetical protein ABIQ16_02450 [Polyangiaceae bacterium]
MVASERASGFGKWLLGVAALPVLFSACSDNTGSDAGGAGAPGSAGSTSTVSSNACHARRAQAPALALQSALDAPTVARAAAVLGACLPDDGVARNADYLWSGEASGDQFYQRYQMQLDCLANSACGCAATANCLGYTAGPVTTCESGCIGAVFTACGPDFDLNAGFGVDVDCQSVGLRCDPAAICLDSAPTACDATFVGGCNAAGQPEYCDDDLIRHGPTCADLGLKCAAGACVGSGAACSNSRSADPQSVHFEGTACNGVTLSACVGGKLTTVDCTTRGPGFGCQHLGDDFFCGLADECLRPNGFGSAAPTRCVGSSLEFCSAGRLEHIDCLALGFTGCTVDAAHGLYGCTPGLVIP